MSVGCLQEDNGNYSMMRLMSIISLLAAIGFAWLVMNDRGGDNGMTIVCVFLLGAFAPKLVQKFVENKMSLIR